MEQKVSGIGVRRVHGARWIEHARARLVDGAGTGPAGCHRRTRCLPSRSCEPGKMFPAFVLPQEASRARSASRLHRPVPSEATVGRWCAHSVSGIRHWRPMIVVAALSLAAQPSLLNRTFHAIVKKLLHSGRRACRRRTGGGLKQMKEPVAARGSRPSLGSHRRVRLQ